MDHWKKTFLIIWTGQFFSLVSSSTVNFAIIIWLSIETRSAEVLAYAAIAALLPQALIGPFTGPYIDRWDRKLTMILADGFIAFCTLIIALLFYFDTVELWYIYFLLAMRSVGSAFHMPAMQASVPLLAPESALVRIAGVNQVIQSISNIAGPALGALALTFFEIGQVLFLDIVGAVLAIFSLLLVKIPNPDQPVQKMRNMFREISMGIREVTGNAPLKLLFIFSIVSTFCIMPISVLFPLMTLDHFLGGMMQVSWIEIAWGGGMLVGGMALGMRKQHSNKVVLINLMYLVLGLTLAISGILSPQGYWIFLVLTGIAGISAAIYNACFTAVIQEKVQPTMLGRVFSMYISLSLLPAMLGLLGTGFLADHVGLTTTFVISGTVIFFIGVASFCTPSLLRLETKKAIPE